LLEDIKIALPTVLLKAIFVIICIFIGKKIIALLCRSITKLMELRGTDPLLASFAISFIKNFLYVVQFFLIIGVLGISATSFMALLGTAGLAVGLALQGSLSDLAGGMLILIFKPFSKGDYISNNAGIEGNVDRIYVLHTVLITTDNKAIIIPNGQLAHSTIINFSRHPIRRLDLTYTVSYNTPTNKVISLLTKIAEENPHIMQDKPKIIRLMSFNDSSLGFVFRVWVKNKNYWDVLFACNERVKEVFDENGIEIPYKKIDIYQK
jgi:small conductance mechanosensitive channel